MVGYVGLCTWDLPSFRTRIAAENLSLKAFFLLSVLHGVFNLVCISGPLFAVGMLILVPIFWSIANRRIHEAIAASPFTNVSAKGPAAAYRFIQTGIRERSERTYLEDIDSPGKRPIIQPVSGDDRRRLIRGACILSILAGLTIWLALSGHLQQIINRIIYGLNPKSTCAHT